MDLVYQKYDIEDTVAIVKAYAEDLESNNERISQVCVDYLSNEALQSEAWNSNKSNIAEAQRYIKNGLEVAIASIDSDIYVLNQTIETADECLWESEILSQIQLLQEEITILRQQMRACYRMMNSINSLNAKGAGNILISYKKTVCSIEETIANLQQMVEELKEKLRLLYQINSNTSGLFCSTNVLLTAVSWALEYMHDSINLKKERTNKPWKSVISVEIDRVYEHIAENAIVLELGIDIKEVEGIFS